MDRSYRLKMEERLKENVLPEEYVLNCVAKQKKKIEDTAKKEKQYRNTSTNNYKNELEGLIAYRKPFIDFLMKECSLSLDEIKEKADAVKEKNYPTQKVCDLIRDIILDGGYWIDE